MSLSLKWEAGGLMVGGLYSENKDENIHKKQSFVALTTDRRTDKIFTE